MMKNVVIKWLLMWSFICYTSTVTLVFAKANTINHPIPFHQQMAALESTANGRLGVYVINTANNTHLEYRADEIFPTGCTSKVIGVAAVLKKSMTDQSLLSQRIKYTKKDLTNWNPVTAQHVNDGMSIEDLCAAAIRYSDNTAMNLLVTQLGGLQEMTIFARSLHDDKFHQDHGWPLEAMSGGKGNLKDASTPRGMANSLNQLAFTDILANPQRERLLSWLKTNTTGDHRIRAGVPDGWIVGDKTGSGFYYGTTNDLGIIWPPKCKPIVIAVYFTSFDKAASTREDIIARTTHRVLKTLAKSDNCINESFVETAPPNTVAEGTLFIK